MMINSNITGKMVKTKYAFIGKQKGRELWKPGIVIDCYPNFVLVKFDHFKKCFAYDEIVEISEQEYRQLLQKNEVKNSLIVVEA